MCPGLVRTPDGWSPRLFRSCLPLAPLSVAPDSTQRRRADHSPNPLSTRPGIQVRQDEKVAEACDPGGVTVHHITYEGPASLAMGAATAVADADGVELTSANPPEPVDGQPDRVRLALTVEGTTGDVAVAVRAAGNRLPPDATISLEEA